MDRSYLDTLKSKLILSEVLAPFVDLRHKGGMLWGCCPFHEEKTPSFKVNNTLGSYYCFGCHKHGDAVSFLMEKQGLPFFEAVTQLAEKAGLPPPSHLEKKPLSCEHTHLYEPLQRAARLYCETFLGDEGTAARTYLLKRGFTQSALRNLVRTFGIGSTLPGFVKKMGHYKLSTLHACGLIKAPTQQPTFIKRLMFPLRDHKGRIIGFGGRTWDNSPAKYINSPETPLFSKKNYVYGLYEALQNPTLQKKPIVLVEGYLDVIALQEAGLARAAATLGTAVTSNQLKTLFRTSPQLIMCFDGDAAGQRAALKATLNALPMLTPERRLQFAILPAGEDPQSLIQKNKQTVLEKALIQPQNVAQMLFDNLHAMYQLDDPSARAAAEKTHQQWCATLPSTTLQRAYRDDFRKRLFQMLKGTLPIRHAPLTKPSIKDTAILQEKAILLICLHHPQLIAEHVEQLARLELSPLLDTLRHALLAWINMRDVVFDKHALYAHLQARGMNTLLSTLTVTPQIISLAPFATPQALTEDAAKGLVDLLARFTQSNAMKMQLYDAEQAFASNLEEENWQRLRSLRTLCAPSMAYK